ncbi:MAG: hypothetical protein GX783_06385 [Clostridiales bacterium]|nr:hypothetical protein [Clostridiales bacterium]
MYKWENVTETFSEKARHYSNTYLEICEVYDGVVEVSLFSSKEYLYEIYFSYGRMYGIVYVDAENAYSKREEMKNELAQEYEIHKEPTREFVNAFAEKHEVCLPNDIFFDASPLFDF